MSRAAGSHPSLGPIFLVVAVLVTVQEQLRSLHFPDDRWL